MAAATVTGRQRNNVAGHLRQVIATSVVFAASGDTWTVPGIKNIFGIGLEPTTNVAFGFTVSGNVITLTAASGLTFRGGVVGL